MLWQRLFNAEYFVGWCGTSVATVNKYRSLKLTKVHFCVLAEAQISSVTLLKKKAMVGAQGKDNRWKGIVSLSEELCHKDYSLATF